MEDVVLAYFIGAIIVFLIGVYITRWIFGIGKIISHLQHQNNLTAAQLSLLMKLCDKQGISNEEINNALSNADVGIKNAKVAQRGIPQEKIDSLDISQKDKDFLKKVKN